MSPKLVEQSELPPQGGGSPRKPRLSQWADRLVTLVAVVAHFGWLVLIAVILLNVILRYVVGQSVVALEELQWHIYGASIMIGLSYCLVLDQHVRVDVVAERLSERTRAKIDILAMTCLVIPFCAVLMFYAIPFVEFSLRLNEVSRSPGGLPYRWLIKSLLPFGFTLLAIAAASRALSQLAFLRSS